MSSSSSIDVARYTSASTTESEEENIQEKGALEERVVQKTPDFTSKWWGVAIAIGLLVVVGSGFGIVGLLQTYGVLPPLPPSFQWLVSAIETVGQALPSNGGLWMIAVIGGTIGVSITGMASAKVHQRRMEDKQVEAEKEAEKEAYLSKHFQKNDTDFLLSGDPLYKDRFSNNPSESYQLAKTACLVKDAVPSYYVILNIEGVRTAGPFTLKEAQECIAHLESFGFKNLLETTTFSQSFFWENPIYNYLRVNSCSIDIQKDDYFRIIWRNSKGELEKSEWIPRYQMSAWLQYLQDNQYCMYVIKELTETKQQLEALKGFGFTIDFPQGLNKKSFADLPREAAASGMYVTERLHTKYALIFRLPNDDLICKSNIEPIDVGSDISVVEKMGPLLKKLIDLGFTTDVPKELDEKKVNGLGKGNAIKYKYANNKKLALIFRLPNGDLICKSNIDPSSYHEVESAFKGAFKYDPF